MPGGRRRFLRWTLGGAAGAVLSGSVHTLRAETGAAGDAWLDAIAARKHRVFLDVGYFGPEGGPFRRTKALLTTLHDSYGATDTGIGVAFGAHGSGLGYLLTPAAWDELGLVEIIAGSNLRSADAATVRSGTKNWGTVGADNVPELRSRGVKFLVCRQTIARWSERIGVARGVPAAEITARIVGGLHQGVEPVPAMITAAVLAQGRGLGYVSLS